MNVLCALVVTLAMEIPVVCFAYRRERLRMALVALVANIVTNLVLNVLLPWFLVTGAARVLLGESFALAAEGAAYAFASRRHGWSRALIVSAIANVASYELGGWVLTAIDRIVRGIS